MTMLNNLKIGVKVAAGTGLLLFLLLVIGSVAYDSLHSALTAFTDYRHIARQNNALGRIQNDMLEVRLHAKDFLIKDDEDAQRAVREQTTKVEELVNTSKDLFDDAEARNTLDEIITKLTDYQTAFRATYDSQKQRNNLLARMNQLGPAMEQSLTAIMESAHRDGDGDVAYMAGETLRSMLLGRLHATKFLVSHSAVDAEQTNRRVAASLTASQQLATVIKNAESTAHCAELISTLKEYTSSFDELKSSINARDDLMHNALDKIGPLIDRQIEDLKLHGLSIQDQLGPHADAEIHQAVTTTLIISGLAILVGFIVAFGLTRLIARPIVAMTAVMRELAVGNKAVAVTAQNRSDEIGAMAKAVEVFRRNALEAERLGDVQRAEDLAKLGRMERLNHLAATFENKIGVVVSALSGAANEMQAASTSLNSTAEQTNRQSMAVASASQQASANVQTVASAAEELTGSISEIARQVAQSTKVSQTAVSGASRASTVIGTLAEAATRIGEVVQLINSIASQTNLLALNATIEAARAGDAGKGFAVVASEVKILANQTGKATEDIAQQVAAIQSATQQAVAAVNDVGRIIGEINQISSAIAAAVEEQGAATKEISRNVQEAANGTQQVNLNITGVTQAAAATGKAARQVNSVADTVAHKSGDLRTEVESFLASVKAA